MRELSMEKKAEILRNVFTNKTHRGAAEAGRVSRAAVERLIRDAGEAAIEYDAIEKNVPAGVIQVDELWTFIGAKSGRAKSKLGVSAGWGTQYVWTAVCASTGFIIAFHVGNQDLRNAVKFLRKLKAKLPQDDTGALLYRPVIISDGLVSYIRAVEIVFGDETGFARYVKLQTKNGKLVNDPHYGVSDDLLSKAVLALDPSKKTSSKRKFSGAIKLPVQGEVPDELINTARVESRNASLRALNARLVRCTHAFSKNKNALEKALAVTSFYLNYIKRPPKAIVEVTDPKTGKLKKERKPPPAVQLGLTNRQWDELALVEFMDQLRFRRQLGRQPGYPDRVRSERSQSRNEIALADPIADAETSNFFVMFHFKEIRAVVHHKNCVHAKGASKKVGNPGASTEWFAADTIGKAKNIAESLAPDYSSKCAKCLGEYRKLGRRL